MSTSQKKVFFFLTRTKPNEQTLQALKGNLAGNVHIISDYTEAEVLPILKRATMGTKLVLIGEWKLVRSIIQLATFVGFTDEEMIIKGLGDKEEQVFCLKCYQLNTKTDTAVISCSHCGQVLEVSSHYSKRHDAFLGFISLQAPE